MIVVDVLLATICWAGQCYPALVGPATPRGEYRLVQRLTESPGYGGDVLQFHETDTSVMAIHRVWVLKPAERRVYRLTSGAPSLRQSITNGCINVMPEVYQKLVDCCSNDTLLVR